MLPGDPATPLPPGRKRIRPRGTRQGSWAGQAPFLNSSSPISATSLPKATSAPPLRTKRPVMESGSARRQSSAHRLSMVCRLSFGLIIGMISPQSNNGRSRGMRRWPFPISFPDLCARCCHGNFFRFAGLVAHCRMDCGNTGILSSITLGAGVATSWPGSLVRLLRRSQDDYIRTASAPKA